MVSPSVFVLQPLRQFSTMVAAVAIVLTSCSVVRVSLPSAAAAAGISPEQLVTIGKDAIAARIRNGQVELVMFTAVDSDWKATVANSHAARARENSGHLLASGGATDSQWNSFFYGTAADGVASVRVSSAGTTGGRVVNGVWVVALKAKDLKPDDISWQFLDNAGGSVLSGTGIFPPET